MTVDEFIGWVAQDKQGSSVIYHEGYLALDRLPQKKNSAEVRELADVVMALEYIGAVSVVQKQVVAPMTNRSGIYQYIAQRTNKDFGLNEFKGVLYRKPWIADHKTPTKKQLEEA